MTIPTEPIGSIPRPLQLLEAISRHGGSHPSLEPLYDEAVRDTIEQFEATEFTPVRDRTETRPTAQRWITRSFYRACSSFVREIFTSRWLGNRIARAC